MSTIDNAQSIGGGITTDNLDNRSELNVLFNGNGFEFFKIWIVNIFLSIITLGIYSAWAKVRTKQYFYGNTEIDNSSFHYTAEPLNILKGRVLAVGVFIIYSVINAFFPIAGIVLALLFIGFIPWMVVNSLRFNAKNSVYRNISFNFTGSPMGALKTFVLWPLLLIPTLGFIMPYIWYKQHDYIVANSAYGTQEFEFDAKVGDYYKILLFSFVGASILGVLSMAIVFSLGEQMGLFASVPVGIIGYVILFAYVFVALGNIYFNGASLANHGFKSNLKVINMAWLYFTNTVAILLTAGLFIPWAQVRMARYRAETLVVLVDGSLDGFIADVQGDTSALGEEMGGMFDVDVSFV